MVSYFFDTYALIEIMKNNPNYIKFIDENITTAKFNLAELIYAAIMENGEGFAKSIFDRFRGAEIEVSDDVLFKAMTFRFKNKKKNLSYADCIGYVFAEENGLKFLTGDEAFRNMANVVFVK